MLITGANGYIGNCLYHFLKGKFKVIGIFGDHLKLFLSFIMSSRIILEKKYLKYLNLTYIEMKNPMPLELRPKFEFYSYNCIGVSLIEIYLFKSSQES